MRSSDISMIRTPVGPSRDTTGAVLVMELLEVRVSMSSTS
jgi:hypothetical protein